MIYADYEFYTDAYLGSAITSDDFPRLATKASAYIDYLTMMRAAKKPDFPPVKMACCALAEQYQVIETAQALAQAALTAGVSSVASSDSGELQSQTVGSWSRTFKGGGDSAQSSIAAVEAAKQSLESTAVEYLAASGLLRARGYHA